MKNRLKKITKVNFNTAKHDAKIEQVEAEMKREALLPKQAMLKDAALDAWESWKKRLGRDATTKKKLLTMVYDLQRQIGQFRSQANEIRLGEWHAATMSLIEEMIAVVFAMKNIPANSITQYIPNSLPADVQEQMKRDARPVWFTSLDELKSVPFVAKMMAKDGFVGLCRDGMMLVAAFKGADMVNIGLLANGNGAQLPAMRDLEKAILDLESVKPAQH